jgi:uncharacterized membrane protein YeaQ/YmgE (transglycosylase-associated protein family)
MSAQALSAVARAGDSPRSGPARPWRSRTRLVAHEPPATVSPLSLLVLILALLLTGLVVGALARLALPGPDPMPIWATILLGWAGSLVGGIISGIFLGRPAGIIISVLAATLLLYLYRRYGQHRPLTGPGARRLPPGQR